jgi:hypothetical protein
VNFDARPNMPFCTMDVEMAESESMDMAKKKYVVESTS